MKKITDYFKGPTELLLVALVFVMSFYFFVGSFGFKTGAREFPMATSGLTLIFTIAYIVKKVKNAPKEEKKEKTAEERAASREEFKKVMISIVLFSLYVLACYLFSFLIASAVLAVVYPLVYGYKSKLGVFICFIMNVAMILAFQWALGFSLSDGTLIDLSYLFF